MKRNNIFAKYTFFLSTISGIGLSGRQIRLWQILHSRCYYGQKLGNFKKFAAIFLCLLSFTIYFLSFAAFAQANSFETSGFTTLGISTSTTKKLESVIGEIAGSNQIGTTKKIKPGFSNTSHSPGVVSDLVTSTTAAGEGQIQLMWTHTGLDGNLGQASSFEIKVATVPINYSNYSSISAILNVTALTPGTTAQRILSNLPPGQMYYMTIRTKDLTNMYSRISPNTTFYTYAIAPDPVSSLTIIPTSGGCITLAWTATGDDGNIGDLNPGYFRIDYSSNPLHSFSNTIYSIQISTIALAGSQHFYSLSGLLGNATYYATVYIGDEVTVYSGLSQIAQIVTWAYPPTLTSFSEIYNSSFTVSFNANNSSGTEYYLEVSSFSDFSGHLTSGWTSSKTLVFSGLDPNTTYYVRAKARNFSGIETAYSNFGSVYLPKVEGTYNPQTPLTNRSISNGIFTLLWSEVKYDIVSRPIQIKRYEIYRSTSITGVIEKVAEISSNTFSYSQTISNNYWYCVKAVDINNNYSAASIWQSNFEEYARAVSDDATAVVNIPSEVSSELNSSNMILVLENRPDMEIGSTVSSYKLYIRDNSNNAIYRDLNRDVTLIMPLNKSVNKLAAAGIKVNSIPQISYSQYDYAVYYDNGVEEVRLGGVVNPNSGTISIDTRKTGTFKVRQVIRPQNFQIIQTVPRKIFTPNGDGIFDEFHIVYDNTAAQVPIKDAKVYDLGGREISDLVPGSYESKNSLMWDGRDKDGKIVASGIYIYQFKAGDKYYTGTVVVAR